MVKKTTQFSTEFLAKIKKLLEEEKIKLTKDLKKFSNTSGGKDEDTAFPSYGDKEDENAAEVADYAANLTLEENLTKTLRDIDKSLERLQKNDYGICKYCKKSIEEKRLLARPTSSACVECKKTIIQEL